MAMTACCMCSGIDEIGTLRRFSRPPLVIKAVSSGESSVTESTRPRPTTSICWTSRGGAGGRCPARCAGGAGNVTRTTRPSNSARRGVKAIVLRPTENSPGCSTLARCAKPRSFSRATSSSAVSSWPRRSSTGRA
jgi:hypothetical protein